MIKYLKNETLMVNMINMKPVFTQVISRLVLPYIGDEVYPFRNTAAQNLQRWPQSFEKQEIANTFPKPTPPRFITPVGTLVAAAMTMLLVTVAGVKYFLPL